LPAKLTLLPLVYRSPLWGWARLRVIVRRGGETDRDRPQTDRQTGIQRVSETQREMDRERETDKRDCMRY